jgi:hypothetical protein
MPGPRAGSESTTWELTVVFLSHHRGGDQLNKTRHYTAPGVNMLHIAESGAENNKGTVVDFISALLLPSKNSTPVPLLRNVMPAPEYPNEKHVNDNISVFRIVAVR